MIYLNYIKKYLYHFVTGIIFIMALNSCGIWDPADARKVSPNADERVRQNLEEGKGFTLMGGKGKKGSGSYQFATSNPMWRATLELLDFLPLANVDYAGGIVTTDWYNEGASSAESLKITVRFLSNSIRADGLKIIVHKKKCDVAAKCSVKKVSSALESELKVAILKKAASLDRRDKEKNKNFRPKKQ